MGSGHYFVHGFSAGIDVLVVGPGPKDPVRAGLVEVILAAAQRRLRCSLAAWGTKRLAHLLWFQQPSLPRGKLGRMMALVLEIKNNGLEGLVAQALEWAAARSSPRTDVTARFRAPPSSAAFASPL